MYGGRSATGGSAAAERDGTGGSGAEERLAAEGIGSGVSALQGAGVGGERAAVCAGEQAGRAAATVFVLGVQRMVVWSCFAHAAGVFVSVLQGALCAGGGSAERQSAVFVRGL